MTNADDARTSLQRLLTSAESMDHQTRAAIERALDALHELGTQAGAGLSPNTHNSASALRAALAALEDALSTATAVTTLIALGMAGRQINRELQTLRDLQ